MDWDEREILGTLLCVCEGICIVGGVIFGFGIAGIGGAILAGIIGILLGVLLWLLLTFLWRCAFRIVPVVLILFVIILLIELLWGIGRPM